MGELILASQSPQRRAILTQVGIAFVARPTGVEEIDSGQPAAVVSQNARRKALAASALTPHALVLGADTLVSAPTGEILGKPDGQQQAQAHLELLSGTTHHVFGGIALARGGEVTSSAVEVTAVTFRSITPAIMRWYVETGEWEGRAGGYAIQGAGAALVTGIDGDYLNVVGLPLARLLEMAPELLPCGRTE